MSDFTPKKLSLIRILNILEKYSDEKHPLKQEQIAKYLSDIYGLELERKSIGSNLALLKDMGYEIVSDRHGSFLSERKFEDSEIRTNPVEYIITAPNRLDVDPETKGCIGLIIEDMVTPKIGF